MRKKLIATRYMTRFQCVGQDCKDHCCQGWTINLDRADYDRLWDLSKSKTPVLLGFEEAVHKLPSDKQGYGKYASLKFDGNDNCRFLQDNLCQIHKNLGENYLPGACATYPRSLTECEGEYVMSGSLSCPEVARLCLLDPRSLELEEMPWSMVPERIQVKSGASISRNYYADVRQTLENMLSLADHSLSERLYLAAYYARRINTAFHRDLKSGQTVINRVGKRLADFNFREKTLKAFTSQSSPEQVGLQVMCILLIARLSHARRQRYNQLVLDVLGTFPEFEMDHLNRWDASSGPFLEPLWPEYEKRLQKVASTLKSQIELYLTNFCRNYILQEQYLNYPGPDAHGIKLVLHVAMLTFLFVNHPIAQASFSKGHTGDLKALNDCFVDVCQIYMRNISHNQPLFEKLTSLFRSGESPSLAGLVRLVGI